MSECTLTGDHITHLIHLAMACVTIIVMCGMGCWTYIRAKQP